ncbi:APC family permease [Allorhizocola rhizosphaerae]|uniref:APC family permease n=1 Tax=Allorhizocola rhizosphaerae TaxID=1872709 RepID=UPI000E3D79D1|nr:APC family permease [Allorhizocola rhizosphaerae]
MTSLARRLKPVDAVVIGLGAMIGAGVFVVWGPAAAAAKTAPALFAALLLAGLVAACNATGSARLAARYPESGGTYVYGRERLGAFAGYLAGWGFVVGKTASCAAMALTIGFYLWPQQARVVAVAAVVALTAVNLRGVTKTALATKVLVAVTVAVLLTVIFFSFSSGTAQAVSLGSPTPLAAAGLLFFAFAGYARIATLGEEVVEPQRTIPRAVPVALGVVFVLYLLVAIVCVRVLGMARLAASTAPLAEVVPQLSIVVRVGAGIAVCGVLLSLLAGVGRTTLAMARRADLPRVLDRVHPQWRTPWIAELVLAAVVIAVVLLADIRGAIGFSSLTVLTYYAITNLSAWTLGGRWWLKAVAALGFAGCVLLAVTLPPGSVIAGVAVLAVGCLTYAVTRR